MECPGKTEVLDYRTKRKDAIMQLASSYAIRGNRILPDTQDIRDSISDIRGIEKENPESYAESFVDMKAAFRQIEKAFFVENDGRSVSLELYVDEVVDCVFEELETSVEIDCAEEPSIDEVRDLLIELATKSIMLVISSSETLGDSFKDETDKLLSLQMIKDGITKTVHDWATYQAESLYDEEKTRMEYVKMIDLTELEQQICSTSGERQSAPFIARMRAVVEDSVYSFIDMFPCQFDEYSTMSSARKSSDGFDEITVTSSEASRILSLIRSDSIKTVLESIAEDEDVRIYFGQEPGALVRCLRLTESCITPLYNHMLREEVGKVTPFRDELVF